VKNKRGHSLSYRANVNEGWSPNWRLDRNIITCLILLCLNMLRPVFFPFGRPSGRFEAGGKC